MVTTPYIGTWECPDLFPLHHPEHNENTVWILAISIQVKTQDPTQFYLCGDFNGHEFIPFKQDKYQIADYGLDFYAAQSWSNAPENAVTWIGWCNNWNYAAQTPDTGLWRGTMSLPRKVSLTSEDSELIMIQQPIQTLEQLREMKGSFSLTEKNSPSEISLEGSDLWDISLAGIPLTVEEPLELTFLWNQGDVLKLSFSPHEFMMDRSSCGSLFSKGLWNRIKAPLSSRTLTDCRILLDRGLIEVFLDGGRSCMTNQIFPAGRLKKLRITPGNRIEEIKGFPLRSIWGGM
jgi:fructan beta-fructosidase